MCYDIPYIGQSKLFIVPNISPDLKAVNRCITLRGYGYDQKQLSLTLLVYSLRSVFVYIYICAIHLLHRHPAGNNHDAYHFHFINLS